MLSRPQRTAITTGAFGAATLGAFAYAAHWPTSQLFGRTVIAGHYPNQITLTFDDGPNPEATPALLDILARYNVRATFFLIGRFARTQPALVRRIADAGHLVGNHTMTHPRLALLPETRIRAELATTSHLLEDILSAPITLFRPPNGSRRPAVLRIARELGMSTVMWNVIVSDWNPVSAQTIATRVLRGITGNQRRNRGSNIVLHDGGHSALGQPRWPTVRAVESFLSQPNNYTFTLPESTLGRQNDVTANSRRATISHLQ